MDASRWVWIAFFTLTNLCLQIAPVCAATEATHRTTNFVVHAPTQDAAYRVAEAAEFWRDELAMQWLGKKLPRWFEPCQVKVQVGQIGAGGATTFSFEGGEVFGWHMRVQGTLERILDSVIPHEVSHTIFACHFRRPLPRWADEGAATLVEHESERHRQVEIFQQVIRERNQIPLSQLLDIDEYPKDMQKVLALYAEGYSLANFLVQQRGEKEGRAAYLAFLGDALSDGWESAFRKHYGFKSIGDLDKQWNSWVLSGSPPLRKDGTLLAQASSGMTVASAQKKATVEPAAHEEVTIRGQSDSSAPLPRLGRPMRAAASTSKAPARKEKVSPAKTPNPSTPLPPTHRTPVASSSGRSPTPQRQRISLELEPAEIGGE